MSGYDSGDILSQALDLFEEQEAANIFLTQNTLGKVALYVALSFGNLGKNCHADRILKHLHFYYVDMSYTFVQLRKPTYWIMLITFYGIPTFP